MGESSLSKPENRLDLRSFPMTPEDEKDPHRALEGSTTDPMFPPKLGNTGPAPVGVTAIQGPGATEGKVHETSTERLLTGLLQGENDSYLYRAKVKESHGEDAAAFNTSPRPAPVAHEIENETPVIVEGARKTAKREPEVTAPIRPRRSEKWIAFVLALFVVGVAGIILVSWRNGDGTEPPVGSWPNASQVRMADPQIPPPDPNVVANPAASGTGGPIEVTSDPVIESQRMMRPKAILPRPAGQASAPASAAGANPLHAPPSGGGGPVRPPPPDFDELKKGINH